MCRSRLIDDKPCGRARRRWNVELEAIARNRDSAVSGPRPAVRAACPHRRTDRV